MGSEWVVVEIHMGGEMMMGIGVVPDAADGLLPSPQLAD